MSDISIIGGGPAGLMAAEALATAGHSITLYDRKPTFGRKFIMAGRGGLNLTHSEPLETFLTRYGSAAPRLAAAIKAFPPTALRAWCDGLGARNVYRELGPCVSQNHESLAAAACVASAPVGAGRLTQKVPVTGAVIVTTPQDIALIDARKGLKMFEKVNVPILGIVENMSIHICSKCGHEEHIFGHGGGEQMRSDYDVEFLGSLPLGLAIREMADGGKPTVVGAPDSRTAESYRGIARRVAVKIGEKAKDMTSKFPNIVVQNT